MIDHDCEQTAYKFDEYVCAYFEIPSLDLRFSLSFFLSFPMKLISDKLFLFSCLLAEEREKPELLAESPERRKRVAQDSGKTEQQVMDCWVLVSFWNFFTTPE